MNPQLHLGPIEACEPIKAAMLWADTLGAMQSEEPVHAELPARSEITDLWGRLRMLGARRPPGKPLRVEHPDFDRAFELMDRWIKTAVAHPRALPVLGGRLRFAFHSDARIKGEIDAWVEIHPKLLIEPIGYLKRPFDFRARHPWLRHATIANVACCRISGGAATPGEAMDFAHRWLTSLGLEFSPALQAQCEGWRPRNFRETLATPDGLADALPRFGALREARALAMETVLPAPRLPRAIPKSL